MDPPVGPEVGELLCGGALQQVLVGQTQLTLTRRKTWQLAVGIDGEVAVGGDAGLPPPDCMKPL